MCHLAFFMERKHRILYKFQCSCMELKMLEKILSMTFKKVGAKMRKVSMSIAGFLFIAWIVALLVNIDIYRKTNIELNVFGPITDAILLMLIAVVIYIVVAVYSGKSKETTKWVNGSLFILGICAVFFISFFYVATFR